MEDDDSKNSESSPALKIDVVTEFDVINTTKSLGTENKMTTLKGEDMPPVHGHEDISGDVNNGDNVTVLQNDHCNECGTTLNDKRSMNHHLKRHQ